MNENVTAHVTRERRVNAYSVMWHASGVLLKYGQEDRTGQTWKFMASLTFTAFTLEAYLNQIGPKLLACWPDLERPLSPLKKLALLSELVGVKIDYGVVGPHQTIKRLFNFRNDIAHLKPELKPLVKNETLTLTSEALDSRMGDFLEPEWQQYRTEENAIRAREDVEQIIKELHLKANIEEPVFSQGLQLSSAKVVADEH